MRASLYRVAIVACLILYSAGHLWADPVVIAYSRMTAPGSGGRTFAANTLANSLIANGTSIAFYALTTDGQHGIWRWQDGTLSKVIFAKDPLPGFSSELFNDSTGFAVGSSNHIAIATSKALLEDNAGVLVTRVKTGDPAPGTNSTFGAAQNLAVSANGDIQFRGHTGAFGSVGLWRATAGGTTPIAVEGQSLSDGRSIFSLGTLTAPTPGSGTTSFPVGFLPFNSGLMTQSGNDPPKILAEAGQHAPGLTTETYSQFWDLRGNDSGQLLFRAVLGNGPVGSALYRDMGVGPQFLVGTGSSMPGPIGGTLSDLGDHKIGPSGLAVFNGDLAFSSVPPNSPYQGFWSVDVSGQLHEINHEGNPVPGMPGVTFGGSFGHFDISVTNQVAWLEDISGLGINGSNNLGLWALDHTGHIVLVVRKGDVVQVGPGVFRTVKSIDFSELSTFNGPLSAWTNNGLLAYTLHFTDNTSGFFYSAVPEPSGMVLATLGLVALLRWPGCLRKRRDHRPKTKLR